MPDNYKHTKHAWASIAILCFFFSNVTIHAQDSITRNTILLESNFIASTSISYSRIFPIKEKIAFSPEVGYILGTGFGYGSHAVVLETNVLFFGPRHFLEAGAQCLLGTDFADDGKGYAFGLRTAYRYQGKKGLSLRTVVNFLPSVDPPVLPTIGAGYSF